MPLSDTSDPVIRVVRGIRRDVRALIVATVVLYIVFAGGFSLALYIRSNDLEYLTRAAAEEAVFRCYRDSAQRAELRIVRRDPTLPRGVQDLLDVTIANLSTLSECHELSRQLRISVPGDPGG